MIAVATSPNPGCYLPITADLGTAMGYHCGHLASTRLTVRHDNDEQSLPLLIVEPLAFENIIESANAKRNWQRVGTSRP